MTLSLRRVAVAAATGLLMVGLPVAAEADTSPTGTPSGITTCGAAATQGATTVSTGTSTTTGTTGTSGTTGTGTTGTGTTSTPTTTSTTPTPATTTTGSTTPPAPCIEAGGNVYIFYVITITTTTTNTQITAPILAANGAITWVTGIPVSAIAPSASGSSASTGVGSGGWTECTATSGSGVTSATTLSCPVIPGAVAGQKPTGKIKLVCESAPATTSKKSTPAGSAKKTASAGSGKKKKASAGRTHGKTTKATHKRAAKPKRAKAKPKAKAHFVVYCTSA